MFGWCWIGLDGTEYLAMLLWLNGSVVSLPTTPGHMLALINPFVSRCHSLATVSFSSSMLIFYDLQVKTDGTSRLPYVGVQYSSSTAKSACLGSKVVDRHERRF